MNKESYRQRNVWFYRNYQGQTGGHIKFSQYLGHVTSSANWQPRFVLSEDSQQDLFWSEHESHCVERWRVEKGDVVFVAGMDWVYFDFCDVPSAVPVINLIQGLRHADPEQILFQYLSRDAIRICVSEEVKAAVEVTERINGPIFALNNGIKAVSSIELVEKQQLCTPIQNQRWLLVGIKNPVLASQVSSYLVSLGIQVELLIEPVSQPLFLNKLGRAGVVVCFPLSEEGFYLPALEAMARYCLVMCPDCVGNRSFCHESSALIPEHNIEGYISSINKLVVMPEDEISAIRSRAFDMSKRYTLENERERFLAILDDAYRLWLRV